jgi:hypothetical protein
LIEVKRLQETRADVGNLDWERGERRIRGPNQIVDAVHDQRPDLRPRRSPDRDASD